MSIDGPRYAANLAYLADEPHAVYIVWRGDDALYVGMTSDWRSRTSVHWRNFPDATHIDVWHVAANRYEAEVVERDTIRDLDPPNNHRHSPTVERRDADRLARAEARREYEATVPLHVREPELWRRMADAVESLPVIT